MGFKYKVEASEESLIAGILGASLVLGGFIGAVVLADKLYQWKQAKRTLKDQILDIISKAKKDVSEIRNNIPPIANINQDKQTWVQHVVDYDAFMVPANALKNCLATLSKCNVESDVKGTMTKVLAQNSKQLEFVIGSGASDFAEQDSNIRYPTDKWFTDIKNRTEAFLNSVGESVKYVEAIANTVDSILAQPTENVDKRILENRVNYIKSASSLCNAWGFLISEYNENTERLIVNN